MCLWTGAPAGRAGKRNQEYRGAPRPHVDSIAHLSSLRVAVRNLDARKVRFQLLFFTQFAAFSGFAVYRNVYLEEIGLTGGQMGLIGAVMTLAGVLAQPIWGVVTDWRGAQKQVLVLGALVSAVGILVYPLGEGIPDPFWLLVAGTAVYSAFRAPVVPIANSMVLANGFDYGNVRAFGSIAFGIGSLGFGLLVASLGVPIVVYFYVVGMVVLVAVAWGLPSADAGDGETEQAHPVSLLTNLNFLILLAVAFLLGMSMRGGSAFFSVYMRAIDAGDALTGVSWTIKTLFEAVAFLYALRLGLSYKSLLVLGSVGTAAQFAVYWATTNPLFILSIQAASGLGYALYYLGAVNLAHDLASESLKSTAQTVLAGAGMGAGGAVGQVVAGRLMETVGIQDMYVYVAAIGLVAAAAGLLVRGGGSPEAGDASGAD